MRAMRPYSPYKGTIQPGFCALIALVLLISVLCGLWRQSHPADPPRRIQPPPPSPSQEPEITLSPAKPDLEVLRYTTDNDGNWQYVVGIVRNNTDHAYDYAQVSINVYNHNGVQVGSVMDNINNLEPHGLWNFKAIVTEKDAASFKITKVSGF